MKKLIAVSTVVAGIASFTLGCADHPPTLPSEVASSRPSFGASTPFNNAGQCLAEDAVDWYQFVGGLNESSTVDDVECVANDVEVSNVVATEMLVGGVWVPIGQGPVQCTDGEVITLRLYGTLENNATADRLDIGLWLATDGGDAKTGSCNHYNLPVNPLPEGVTNLDVIPDSCGNLSNGSSPTIDLGAVNVVCHAGPSGSVEISACVAWSTPTDRVCPIGSVSEPDSFRVGTLPNIVAKCNCQPVVITTGSPPPQTGSITIVKDVVPEDPQDFSFTTTGSGLSSFSLDDDSDGTLPNTRTFSGLVAGDYTVTEVATPGFDLTALTCTTGGLANVANRTATIALAQGANVTCTFNNAKISGGSITLQTGSFTLLSDALSGNFSIRNSSGGTQQVFVTSLAIVNATFRDGPNLVQATVTGCVYTPLPVVIPASGSQNIALSGCQVTPSVRKELMFTVRATINGGDQPFYERTYKVRTQ